MKRLLKFILILFLGFSSQTSFCQDTSKPAFRIVKIYATAAGITSGTIDRDALVDSGGIVIQGCPDCRVEGFQLTFKTRQNVRPEDTVYDSMKDSTTKYVSKVYADPRGDSTARILYSKSDLFTPEMKYWIGYNDNDYVSSSVEISNIKVITPEGKTNTLDKIYLLLK